MDGYNMGKELRKARIAAFTERFIKIAICAAVGCYGYYVKSEEGTVMALVTFAISFSVCWWAYSILKTNKAYAAFASLYKKELITSALYGNVLFEEMQFDYDCGINETAVDESGLIHTDRFFSDCFISGTYNGVSFIQADVRNLSNDKIGRSSGGYVLDYDGTLAVIPTSLPDASQTNIADRTIEISYLVSGKEYATGNAEFDKAFKVYSTDFHKAGKLLSPDFTHRLMRIKQQMDGKMAVTVKNGTMYIFMSRKNSPLKPGLFKKYNDEMKPRILSELSRVKLFIDAFSL